MVGFAMAHACQTFGEIAELSEGPCERCVGRALWVDSEPSARRSMGRR